MTDDGCKDCTSVHKTIRYEIWKLTTKRHQLKCADNHIVFNSNMDQVFVKDLSLGQLIMTDDGLDEVVSIENTH